jgi:hypothetical protein
MERILLSTKWNSPWPTVVLQSNSGGIWICAGMNSSCVILRMKCVILRMKCVKHDECPWNWDDKRWSQVSSGN